MITCLLDDCERPKFGRGYCQLHYSRLLRHGTTEGGLLSLPREERFWRQVAKAGPDDCWLWTGRVSTSGYGRLGWDYTHRFAYELANGPIPDGLQILHSCDVPLCVNVQHLRAGTHYENAMDAVARQRYKRNSPRFWKVGETQVVEIRQRAADGESYQSLADAYGLQKDQIGRIVRRKSWSWVA